MQKITPFLWFDGNAEEATNFYISVFPNSKLLSLMGQPGQVFGTSFELNGQVFNTLNGGPMFKFNEAISFFVSCADQAEVDYYWEKLTADGGQESRCGWLKDKYGLSWQIIPEALPRLFSDPDREKANRAMQAMMGMQKIIVADLEAAHRGE
jgi:predicted 3-demethylubiquinone-9 3-methyltransferase (glyoxalase superfamily)